MFVDEVKMSFDRPGEDAHQHGSVPEHFDDFGNCRVRFFIADDDVHAGMQLDARRCVANVRVRQAAFVRPVIIDP